MCRECFNKFPHNMSYRRHSAPLYVVYVRSRFNHTSLDILYRRRMLWITIWCARALAFWRAQQQRTLPKTRGGRRSSNFECVPLLSGVCLSGCVFVFMERNWCVGVVLLARNSIQNMHIVSVSGIATGQVLLQAQRSIRPCWRLYEARGTYDNIRRQIYPSPMYGYAVGLLNIV